MRLQRIPISVPISVIACLMCLASIANTYGQSSSLIHPGDRLIPPQSIGTRSYRNEDLSLIYQPEPKKPGIHDILIVQISEDTLLQVNARVNRQRTTDYEYEFDDWVAILSGLKLRPDLGIRNTQPGIDVSSQNNMRTQAQSNRQDRISGTIAVEVADVRPNGNLVIEGHANVSHDNEIMKIKLSGVCRQEHVNNRTFTIDSSKIAKKNVEFFTVGPTRDSTKRGWLMRIVDMFLPF